MSRLYLSAKDLDILKPCPFCGGVDFEAEISTDSFLMVRCPECRFSVCASDTLSERVMVYASLSDLCLLPSSPKELEAFAEFLTSFELLVAAGRK